MAESADKPATRQQIIAILTEHAEQLQKLGVKRIALFGSAARDCLSENSDVDLVVELETADYSRYLQCKDFLENILRRRVDMLTPDAVRGRLGRQISEDLVYVA